MTYYISIVGVEEKVILFISKTADAYTNLHFLIKAPKERKLSKGTCVFHLKYIIYYLYKKNYYIYIIVIYVILYISPKCYFTYRSI